MTLCKSALSLSVEGLKKIGMILKSDIRFQIKEKKSMLGELFGIHLVNILNQTLLKQIKGNHVVRVSKQQPAVSIPNCALEHCTDSLYSTLWPLIGTFVQKRWEPVTDKLLYRKVGPVVSDYSHSADTVWLCLCAAHTHTFMYTVSTFACV